MRTPDTQYAEVDGLNIAYQVFGQEGPDLVLVPGAISNTDYAWELPEHAEFLRKLAQSFRVIVFDKRGQGMSDRFDGVPDLDERMDDILAVMQAVGSTGATLFSVSEGGPMCVLFAATFPDLVHRLVMYGAMARFLWAVDYPHRRKPDSSAPSILDTWGTGRHAGFIAPSKVNDEAFAQYMGRLERMSATPRSFEQFVNANRNIDVRAVLPEVRAETLVIQRRFDQVVTVGNGRYLADHIPHCTYLELPGGDHLPWIGDHDAIVDALVRFAGRDSEPVIAQSGRHLSAVLFTDIEDSTRIMANLGDNLWHQTLDRHDQLSRNLVSKHRGEFIKSTGDGILALFNGPSRAVRCASELVSEAETLGLRLRAGVHAGEVERRSNDDLTGIAVHTAARVMSAAPAGEVRVSQIVVDITNGTDLAFTDLGEHELKGVPEPVRLHAPVFTAD